MAYAATVTRFPNLRQVAAPWLESVSDPEFADVVRQRLGIPPEVAEGWLQDFGKAFVQRAPGIAQGALAGGLSGAPLGLPGIIGGALLGGLGAGLTQQPGGATPAAAAPGARPPTPSGPAGGSPAAGTVLQLLSNPDLQKALFSMFMGKGVGRESLEIAGEQVPPAELVNLLREAADQALEQYAASETEMVAEDLPEYLAEARRRGNDVGDPFVRGVVLAKLLDQPTYVPVPPAPAPAPTVVYPGAPTGYPAPAQSPVAPAPGQPVAGAPSAPDPYAFEPVPTYSTPDLGIGQPIPTQSYPERARAARRQMAFEQSLDEIFELGET
jgi:hypothetical protein